jgi:hypothetical protein
MLLRCVLASAVLLIVLLTVSAQNVAVVTAHGKVQKADKETLTFQPRDDSGKFGKGMTLKITGTSRITTLVPQTKDKKQVMTQRDTDAKDLTAGQIISVIYATPKGQDPVLLSAVIHPADDK